MSNDTREALAADIMNLRCDSSHGRGVNYALGYRNGHRDARHAAAELVGAALTEQPAAPQLSHFGDSVERCGSPSGAVSGGSASQVPHGWVSVDEMLPKPNEMVLLWVEAVRYVEDGDGRRHERDESCVDFGHWQLSDGFGDPYFDNYAGRVGDAQHVTHWMPLPKPPVAMGHVGQEPSLEASVAGPEARPDQQSDSSAAPQGAQEQFIVGSWHDERLRAVKDFYGIEVTSGPRQGVAAPAQEPQQPAPHVRPLLDIATSLAEHLHQVQDWIDEHLAAAASSPAPAVQPLTMGRIYEVWHEIGADVAGLSWAKFAEALQHGQPQGGSNG